MLSKARVPCFGVNTIAKVFTQRQFLPLVNTIVLLFSIWHSLKYYYQTLEQYRGVTPAISLDKMFQQDYILFTLFPELRLSWHMPRMAFWFMSASKLSWEWSSGDAVLASTAKVKSCKDLFQKLHYVHLCVILLSQIKERKYLPDDHRNKSILTSGFSHDLGRRWG